MALNKDQQTGFMKVINFINGPDQFMDISGGAGTGKEQPLTAIIQTPIGPTTMGQLKVGSIILGSQGTPITVTGVFPQGYKTVYTIKFRDGTSTECGIDHLWSVYTSKGNLITKSLKSIIASGIKKKSGAMKFKIPLTSPVVYKKKNFTIDPYVLGAFIGDGALTNQISISIPHNKSHILTSIIAKSPSYLKFNLNSATNCPSYRVIDSTIYHDNWFKEQIVNLGLNVKSTVRFIPKQYLLGSIAQRTQLLYGLMDTDGTTRKGRTSFSTMSPTLARDIQNLVQSLGGTAIIHTPTKRDKEICVNIKTMFCPFSGGKKKNIWKAPTKNPPSRYIKEIIVGKQAEQQCINVSANDNLYLTDHYIVTHNTYFISQIANTILKHKNINSPLHTVAITATTNKAVAVIAEAMPKKSSEIQTIYKYMNLRVSENFSTGNVKIVPTPKWYVHSGALIIIDECSMINSDLFKYIKKGIDSTCKVLFVGDKNQLAPVKENLSPIYTQGFDTSYLSVPVRNAGKQALMDLCEQAKQTVITGVFTPIVEVPGVIDLVDGVETQGVLEREFLIEDPTRRVLSYTNKRVIEYNSYIRKLRSYTKPFEVGEILSNNNATDLIGKERLYTDQIVRVTKTTDGFIDKNIISGEEIRMMLLEVEDANTKQGYCVIVFENYNDRAAVLKYYSGKKQWEQYFKIKNGYPDLRSVSASTTHKAQGSTYEKVIVDLADIGKSTNREQTARMQYVALSRPKTQIFIRGRLPDRYFT